MLFTRFAIILLEQSTCSRLSKICTMIAVTVLLIKIAMIFSDIILSDQSEIFSSLKEHRHRSGWTSGGMHGEHQRWVRVEWGGIWGGVSPLQPTKGSGGASWALPAGSKATERSFLYLYDKILGGGQFVLASPAPNSGGTCPRCPSPPSPPWSTPMWKSPRGF